MLLTTNEKYINICIHMLTKRTNILFSEQLFNYLESLARQNNTSIGELVRQAVTKIYYRGSLDKKIDAYHQVLALKKDIKKITNKEVKDFINYGRQ